MSTLIVVFGIIGTNINRLLLKAKTIEELFYVNKDIFNKKDKNTNKL
jgi:hypothetical protein